MIRKLFTMLALVLMFSGAGAQPFLLKSTNSPKPFQLDIFYGTDGKGAFVQYRGQPGTIPLRLKSKAEQGKTGNPKTTYIWEEVINGKVTGSYGLTQEAQKISAAWYKRNRDAKQFELEHDPEKENYAGTGKFLLHGVMITFYHTMDDKLTFSYPNGSVKNTLLPGFDHPDPQRKATIADYDFDGYEDIAFSIPDAGMGVYRTFSIYLYSPASKQFMQLAAPTAPNAKCTGLCDVTLDKKNKLFITACRGAATWWKDVYRFSRNNSLVWISSGKMAL